MLVGCLEDIPKDSNVRKDLSSNQKNIQGNKIGNDIIIYRS